MYDYTSNVPYWFQVNGTTNPGTIQATLVVRWMNVYLGHNTPLTECLPFELDREDERSATTDKALGQVGLVYSGQFYGWNMDAKTQSFNGCLEPLFGGRTSDVLRMMVESIGVGKPSEMVIVGKQMPVAICIQGNHPEAEAFAVQHNLRVIRF
jgi:hypothetical protein